MAVRAGAKLLCTTTDMPTNFQFTIGQREARVFLDPLPGIDVKVHAVPGPSLFRRQQFVSHEAYMEAVRVHLSKHWLPTRFTIPATADHAFRIPGRRRCPQRFREHVLKFHMLRKYQCPECPETFLTDMRIFEHMYLEHAKGAYTCPNCQKKHWRVRRVQCMALIRNRVEVPVTVDLCLECYKMRTEEVYAHLLRLANIAPTLFVDQALQRSLGLRGCKLRPDMLWPVGDGYLVVEIDEKQHRAAAYVDNDAEPVRLDKMHKYLGSAKLVVVRVNPDAYWPHVVNLSYAYRQQLLVQTCQWIAANIHLVRDGQLWVAFIGYDNIPESYARAKIRNTFSIVSKGLLWVFQQCIREQATTKTKRMRVLRQALRKEGLVNRAQPYAAWTGAHFDVRAADTTFDQCMRRCSLEIRQLLRENDVNNKIVVATPTIEDTTRGSCPRLYGMEAELEYPVRRSRRRRQGQHGQQGSQGVLASVYDIRIAELFTVPTLQQDAERFRTLVDTLYAAHALLWEAGTHIKTIEKIRVDLFKKYVRPCTDLSINVLASSERAKQRMHRQLLQNRFDS